MYNALELELHPVAAAAQARLEARFKLRNPAFEGSFDSGISLAPTIHWKKEHKVFACEVAETPFPNYIQAVYSELIVGGSALRLFIAFPEENKLSADEFQKQQRKAWDYGIGLVPVSSNGAAMITHQGIFLPAHLPPIKLSQYKKPLRADVEAAYETYMNGDCGYGIQALGQVVENIIRNVASQAKNARKFNFNKDPFKGGTSQASIIDALVSQNVLDVAVLGRCRAFVVDRNAASHRPKSKREAIEQEQQLRENFLTGLRVLRDLPSALQNKGYRLKF